MKHHRIKDTVLALGAAIALFGIMADPTTAQEADASLTASPDSVVNLRSGPGTDFAVVSTGLPGEAVTILETHQKEGSSWHRVQFEGSGTVGWARADLVLEGGIPVSDRCHGELAAARAELNAVPEGFLRAIYIGYDEQAPANRPVSLLFFLGGPGQASVLSSPQFMLSLSQEVIDDCGSISSVRFGSDSSGWHDIYGLVGGEVTGFTCVGLHPEQELEWGEFFCEP
ncbi:MAG: SH3 domain-containing protein [Leptolyngbyaceae cyanobacterium]